MHVPLFLSTPPSRPVRPRKKPASQIPGQIHCAGLAAPVTLRQNSRAKRMTLRVCQSRRGAILTIPPKTSRQKAERFLKEHRDWLRQKLAALPAFISFDHSQIIPFRGDPYRLEFHPSLARGINRVPPMLDAWNWSGEPVTDTIKAQQKARDARWEQRIGRLLVGGPADIAPQRVLHWLKQKARETLTERSAHHARQLGVSFRKIAIRDQNSRWGSCSSTGTLSYSWRLILAPDFVLDYVAAHEVAHLQEMNHSPAFWALVYRTLPGMEKGRDWLKRHGDNLHRYGVV